MKHATIGASSFLAGILVAVYCRRYVGAFIWWLFTADLRG